MKNLTKVILFTITLINVLNAQCIGNDYEQEQLLSESIIEDVTVVGFKSALQTEESMQLTQNVEIKDGYSDSKLFYYICVDKGSLEMVDGSLDYKTIEYTAPSVSVDEVATIDFKIGDGYGNISYKHLEVKIESKKSDFTLSLPSSYVIFKNQTVSLSASTSNIENESEATYSWDFKDGTTGDGKSVEHTYSLVGTYYAKVIVSYRGKTKTATTQIRVKDEKAVKESVHIMLEKKSALESENVTGWVWFDNISNIDRDIDISHSGKNVGISSFVQIKAGTQIGSFVIRERDNSTIDTNEYVTISASTSKSNIATTKLYIIDEDDQRVSNGAENGLKIVRTIDWKTNGALEADKRYKPTIDIKNLKSFDQSVTAKIEVLDTTGASFYSDRSTCKTVVDAGRSEYCRFGYMDISDTVPTGEYNVKISVTSSDCPECHDTEYLIFDVVNNETKDIEVTVTSKSKYSLDIEDIDDKVVSVFMVRAYNARPTKPHLVKVYMKDENGKQKVILNKYLNLRPTDWQKFLVYLPSDTVAGVYQVWIEAESLDGETNITNNKSAISTITVTDKNRIITPELQEVSNLSLLEGKDYTQQLKIIKGTEPIKYEIASVPSSTISVTNSGLIKWVNPLAGVYRLTAKVSNNIGKDEKSWTISVKSLDTDNDGIPDDQDRDDDNDGISDLDELANNLNPLDPTDADADNDNDGYTNAQEIESGTDINDANSKPTPKVTTRTITIRKGFGLYGMNSSMTLAQLIEKIGIDNLLSINSNGETYQLNYVKEGLEGLNDFTQLEPFKAVWIEVATEITFSYDEINYSEEEQEITLESGKWYLLNPPKEMSLENIKAQLGNGNIVVIQGISTTYQQQYIDDGIGSLNDFNGFKEPLGYWIKIKDTATLKF